MRCDSWSDQLLTILVLFASIGLQYKHIWHAAMKPPPDWGVSAIRKIIDAGVIRNCCTANPSPLRALLLILELDQL
jgi:hypothetical protein